MPAATRRIPVLARVLLLLLAGIVMLKALIGSMEPRFVFFPLRGEDANPSLLDLRYERLTLQAADGERIAAWQLEPENPSADVVYFHGNGGNLSVWLPVFAALHQRGYRVLAFDYRGYGLSTGTPTEDGVYQDGETMARHAASRRAAGRPLVFWGRSLGTAIAAAAARLVTPDGLVLESGFPDKAAVARTQPLLGVLNLFASYRFPTAELLEGFPRPVLVMHGDADSVIPYALGRRLFERIGGPKEFVAIPGGDHNDFFAAANEAYWAPVARFIDRLR